MLQMPLCLCDYSYVVENYHPSAYLLCKFKQRRWTLPAFLSFLRGKRQLGMVRREDPFDFNRALVELV
jgi:hypothetical protein